MVARAWMEDQIRILSLCWPLLLSAGAGERVGVLCCPLSATGLLGAPGLMRWAQLSPGLLAPPGVGEVWRRVPERELFPRLLLHSAPPASTSPPSRLDTRPSLALSGALGEGLTFSSSLPGLSSSRARLPAPAALCLPAAPPLGHVHPPISVRPVLLVSSRPLPRRLKGHQGFSWPLFPEGHGFLHPQATSLPLCWGACPDGTATRPGGF